MQNVLFQAVSVPVTQVFRVDLVLFYFLYCWFLFLLEFLLEWYLVVPRAAITFSLFVDRYVLMDPSLVKMLEWCLHSFDHVEVILKTLYHPFQLHVQQTGIQDDRKYRSNCIVLIHP